MGNREAKLNGAQATADKKRRYVEEVAKTEALGEKFPVNQLGEVNVGSFAARCGFSRFVIVGGTLAYQLAADVERFGLAIRNTSRLRKKVENEGQHVD